MIPCKAEFNRNHGGGHTGHAPKEDFYDPEIWKVKALENAKRWKSLYVRYLKARFQLPNLTRTMLHEPCTVLKSIKGMPCHVIYFEDLKDSLKVIMNSILDFISVEIENFDERMRCLQENSEGNFHRQECGSIKCGFVTVELHSESVH